jgi:hypothetical protein
VRNLSRRLKRLEGAIPAPDDGSAAHCRELIKRLSSHETDALKDALENLSDGVATQKDHEIIRSIFRLAQERFDAGLIIARERKPPEQWNKEMREALRMQRETGEPWRSINGYNEFLVEAGLPSAIVASCK